MQEGGFEGAVVLCLKACTINVLCNFMTIKTVQLFFLLVCLDLVNLVFLTSKGLSSVWWGHSHYLWYSLNTSDPQWFIHVSKFNLHWEFIIALEAEKSKYVGESASCFLPEHLHEPSHYGRG